MQMTCCKRVAVCRICRCTSSNEQHLMWYIGSSYCQVRFCRVYKMRQGLTGYIFGITFNVCTYHERVLSQGKEVILRKQQRDVSIYHRHVHTCSYQDLQRSNLAAATKTHYNHTDCKRSTTYRYAVNASAPLLSHSHLSVYSSICSFIHSFIYIFVTLSRYQLYKILQVASSTSLPSSSFSSSFSSSPSSTITKLLISRRVAAIVITATYTRHCQQTRRVHTMHIALGILI
jgi:hypothetical protein